jgi:uncharacterized membrane protein
MSDLIAIAHKDVATAQQVVADAMKLMKEHNLVLDDLVIVEAKEDGKVKLHQPSAAGRGALGGAAWGGLIGLIFFMPLFGMALGAATGAAAGASTDLGVDDNFMKELGSKMTPGSAAVFALVRSSNPDKVRPVLAQHGGTIIQSSLSNEAEAELQAVLDAGANAAAVQ